ncbi:hypothetical protein [Burkholderia sp. MBR-1]|uniref:Nmad2 family putative nucleotide modification protein n=1 Tax=Burkholderia sp. MBR-1 TaxID=2732364 RepID=UPI0015EFCB5C|nr:hypothetical protein [Burkholderia sp. MBR-1]QMI49796.1 hypothetical protein MBR110_30465 [Burkholderia sp. MBR-1]
MSITMGYKMTHDSGFAPNPFHGVLTLATCKPKVRACRRVGEWVAGFASKDLVDRAARRGVSIPRDGLVYLMQVREVLPLHAYFEDSRFAVKQPPRESSNTIALCGDNIYYYDHRGQYEQLENRHHTRADVSRDTSGVNALIAERFYYFGRKCFVPHDGWATTIGAPLSTGRTFYCPDGFAEKMLSYFDAKGIAQGLHALPSLMDESTTVNPDHFCAVACHETGGTPTVRLVGPNRSGSCGG